MSKRSVSGRIKGWPAPTVLFLLSHWSLFCSKAGYFSFICEFKVSNSDTSRPEKFLKCEGFLDNAL